MKYRFSIVVMLSAAVLGWVENSHGRIEARDHEHARGEWTTALLPNGYIFGLTKVPPDLKLPGLLRVQMSSHRGIQIGPHRFRPQRGDLRFSLVKGVPEPLARKLEKTGAKMPEASFFYYVVENDGGRVKESLVDAVSGELIDAGTGKAVDVGPVMP